MPRLSSRKSAVIRRLNRVIHTRTLGIMFLLGIFTFLVLFCKLCDLQIRQHADLQERASSQQTRNAVVTALRGSISDRNGFTMAVSSTAETVNISPREIAQFVTQQQETEQELKKAAQDKGEVYTPRTIIDQTYIAHGLSRILDVEQSFIEGRMERTKSMYETIKKTVDQTVADEVRRFINGEIDEEGNELTELNTSGKTVLIEDHKSSPRKIQGVWLQPDAKRYYPYSSLAANILGFVNAQNEGSVGLELKYDEELEGAAGLTVTAKSANGSELLYQYEQYYDAENGNNLTLTLDVSVQSYLEKGIKSMVDRFDAANGATGIIMDVHSGAILGMASYPTYDPNDYSTVYDSKLKRKMASAVARVEQNRNQYATEEEYQEAYQKAINNVINTQWRNKCIDATYEPGSTFKPLTLAAALEEGVINKNSTFYCGGSVMIRGAANPIHCSNRSGHGTQSLKTAVANSCNPAFINMSFKVGAETYYKYLRDFGVMDKTGVDMTGEVSGIFAKEDDFVTQPVSLASYSFGQTFNVTPLELIRAQAACINGGYLYTPYIVQQITDNSGNIIHQHEAAPVRQVISEETSAIVRECLEYVVSSGTGKNGQVSGYRIGGKTGTADKTGSKTASNPQGDVVVSFMCFAPADDPQYIMLLTLDTPSRNTGVYVSGGNMVAPTASSIMADVLPYLGVQKEYSTKDIKSADAAVPNVVGKTLEEAQARLEKAGFSYRTVGDGGTVTDQTPVGGVIVPNNAQLILYLGANKPDGLCTVPNVIGMTVSEANRALANAGLILRMAGASESSSGNLRALSQNRAEGVTLMPGSVVTVQFGDSSVRD